MWLLTYVVFTRLFKIGIRPVSAFFISIFKIIKITCSKGLLSYSACPRRIETVTWIIFESSPSLRKCSSR